ncbi:PASTA domain-containing protein [Streptomyces sp. NPDC002851]
MATVTMPDVIGMSYAKAVDELGKLSISEDDISEYAMDALSVLDLPDSRKIVCESDPDEDDTIELDGYVSIFLGVKASSCTSSDEPDEEDDDRHHTGGGSSSGGRSSSSGGGAGAWPVSGSASTAPRSARWPPRPTVGRPSASWARTGAHGGVTTPRGADDASPLDQPHRGAAPRGHHVSCGVNLSRNSLHGLSTCSASTGSHMVQAVSPASASRPSPRAAHASPGSG